MPANPPRDASGKIVPHDHPEILPTFSVIRHTTPNDVVNGEISSGAFTESEDGGMSVDVLEWMVADGLDPLHYVTDPSHGAVTLTVAELRALGYQIGWDPDGGHAHHASVWGSFAPKPRRRIKKKIGACLRKAEGEN